MAKKPGRNAFKGLAPKGYRVRMMEPGEAEALLAISHDSAIWSSEALHRATPEQSAIADFVRFLLSHEIFVAVAKRDGGPVGFAAARGNGDVYWMVAHCVVTPHRRRGIGTALLAAVTQRARWFGHQVVGIPATVDIESLEAFYARDGFMTASRKRHPVTLANQRLNQMPEDADVEAPRVLIKLL